ncbi:hypothetical protein OIU77_020947 [Salix suchowensis]|uniref:Uncharacterized protein n=1 Tax=Salix suchowensis TaxID=1278906 RepID=A0ABQ9CBX1_9ROSI|nr:hypothetical protein OIU77_020947 [Salix suchowensis]
MRRGLTAQVIHQTKTMADVYGAFFDFSCMLKSKVDKRDPNAVKTLSRLEAAQKSCRESGALNKRKSYIIRNEPRYIPVLVRFLLNCQPDFLSYRPIFHSTVYYFRVSLCQQTELLGMVHFLSYPCAYG